MNPFFWQPHTNFFTSLSTTRPGRFLLVGSNYFIWIFLFYVSILLISFDANIFWQLLIATILGEAVEKILKIKKYWKRPAFKENDHVPGGLIKSWYLTGSFPSGHTIKAAYFFLFILQYHVISPVVYLIVVVPLIVFRVITGFHYPIDVLGGIILGSFIWFLTHSYTAPLILISLIRTIFNIF